MDKKENKVEESKANKKTFKKEKLVECVFRADVKIGSDKDGKVRNSYLKDQKVMLTKEVADNYKLNKIIY